MKKKVRTRIFTENAGGPVLSLDDPDSISISRVMRLKPEDLIECFNGDGFSYFYNVSDVQRNALSLHLVEKTQNLCDLMPETTIYASAVKGKNNDRIVRDLTPLGATKIIFYHAERSVSRPETNQESRLQKIAVEACRQCGRTTIPKIKIHNQSLQKTLIPGAQSVLFWESEETLKLSIRKANDPIQLIFGPEGGFTEEEINWARSTGVQFCSLGSRILRSELAAIVGLTLMQNLRGIFKPVSPLHQK